MSAFSGFPGQAAGFPGMAAPGQAPQQPATAGAGFVLDIPADPTWEPIEQTDLLEKDGYYCAQIKGEKYKADDKPGVWFSFLLLEQDVHGKVLQKFLPDPNRHQKDMWFLWRGLMRSITGLTQGGQQAMRYAPGAWIGHQVYFRVTRYLDNQGNDRSGVDGFVTKSEWEDAVKANRHRIEPKPRPAGGGAATVGALPGGSAFPGLGTGLPGSPALPASSAGAGFPPVGAATSTPQPTGAPPMQGMPTQVQNPAFQPPANPTNPTQPAFVPPGQPQQQQPVFVPPANPTQPVFQPQQPTTQPFQAGPQVQQPQGGFSFPTAAPPPIAAPPQQAAPPANGVPQPTVMPGGFPGLPSQ